MNLTIAVETTRLGNNVTSVALAYRAEILAPSFAYKDGRRAPRVEGLNSFPRFSEVYQQKVLRYLLQSTVAWTRATRHDGDRDANAVHAVSRLVERIRFEKPHLLQCREDAAVQVFRYTLPPEEIGHIPQMSWRDRDDLPWMLRAAQIVVKAPRPCILRFANE